MKVRRQLMVALFVACCCAALAVSASPHGPGNPGCLSRYSGKSGQRVLVRWVTIAGRFNPTEAQLPLGPPAVWSEHRRGAPSDRLYHSGRYLITFHDGTEGGAHYTWTDFVVKGDHSVGATTQSEPRASSNHAMLAIGAALVGMLVLLASFLRRRPTARARPLRR